MKWFSKVKEDAETTNLLTLDEDVEVEAGDEPTVKPRPTQPQSVVDEDLLTHDVQTKTVIFQPTAYATIKPIVDELLTKKVVLVDLSKLPDADRIRTIDFITGVMYGLNGEYKKIEHKVYKFVVHK